MDNAQTHHPVLAGTVPFAVISGANPKYRSEFQGGHKEFEQYLLGRGHKYEQTHGKYEPTFVVYGVPRNQAMDLGRRAGQESVIFSQNGQHEKIYVNGPNAGKHHPGTGHSFSHTTPTDEGSFLHLPNAGYVKFGFDTSKLLDIPKKGENMLEGTEKSEVTVADFKKALAKTLQNQIDKLSKSLEVMAKTEVANSDGEPLVGEFRLVKSNFSIEIPDTVCPTCFQDDVPGSCSCLTPTGLTKSTFGLTMAAAMKRVYDSYLHNVAKVNFPNDPETAHKVSLQVAQDWAKNVKHPDAVSRMALGHKPEDYTATEHAQPLADPDSMGPVTKNDNFKGKKKNECPTCGEPSSIHKKYRPHCTSCGSAKEEDYHDARREDARMDKAELEKGLKSTLAGIAAGATLAGGVAGYSLPQHKTVDTYRQVGVSAPTHHVGLLPHDHPGDPIYERTSSRPATIQEEAAQRKEGGLGGAAMGLGSSLVGLGLAGAMAAGGRPINRRKVVKGEMSEGESAMCKTCKSEMCKCMDKGEKKATTPTREPNPTGKNRRTDWNKRKEIDSANDDAKRAEYAARGYDTTIKNMDWKAELGKSDEWMEKSAPPGFSEDTMHKLKGKYGTESAFKIAWAAYKKKHHGSSVEKMEKAEHANDPHYNSYYDAAKKAGMEHREAHKRAKEWSKYPHEEHGIKHGSESYNRSLNDTIHRHMGTGHYAKSDSAQYRQHGRKTCPSCKSPEVYIDSTDSTRSSCGDCGHSWDLKYPGSSKPAPKGDAKKSEMFVDSKNEGAPPKSTDEAKHGGPRVKNVGYENDKPAEPTKPVKGKVDEGSGGDVTKGKGLKKFGMPATEPDAGVGAPSLAMSKSKAGPPMAKPPSGGPGTAPKAVSTSKPAAPKAGIPKIKVSPMGKADVTGAARIAQAGQQSIQPTMANAKVPPVQKLPASVQGPGASGLSLDTTPKNFQPGHTVPNLANAPVPGAHHAKSEGGLDDMKKSLGSCLFCGKSEHPGVCNAT